MKVKEITIETIRTKGGRTQSNVVIFWTEDGVPHTLPDLDQSGVYCTKLAVGEEFEIMRNAAEGS